jgi:glycosyltransferase involved in cell wall biosynthesis
VKVGLDATPAIRETAGIGRYTRELYAALLRRGAHDYHLYCLCRERGPGSFPDAPVRHLPVPERWATIAWHRARLPVPIDLLVGRHDLWHFPNFVVPPVMRGNVVVTVHDLSYELLPETAAPGLRRFLNAVVPRSIHRADLVVADSASTKADVERLLGAAPSAVQVVLSGVAPRFFASAPAGTVEALRARLGLRFPYILAVGTLQPRKNYERLIGAVARVLAQGLPQHLVIAGRKGWRYDGIARRIEELGMGDRVHVVEFVPEADLPQLYASADLFVFPSLYEGFGIPPLEAMASGTPVIASNVSSVPESVGEAGILVDPLDEAAIAEGMLCVLQDRQLRQRLIDAGHARAARFTWDAAAARLEELYDALAQARKPKVRA